MLLTAAVLTGVRRIAVLRSGGLGDLVLAEPALSALRAAYPDAEITLLGAPHHAGLVVGRPGPWDRFEVVPFVPGVRVGDAPDAAQEEVERWCAAARARRYDLAVQLHGGGGHSNGLVLRLGGARTVGAGRPEAPRLDVTVPYDWNQHETLRWLEVAAACGAPPVRLEPVLVLTAADRAAGSAALQNRSPADFEDRRLPGEASAPVGLVVLHPGASAAHRRWQPERLAAVGDVLIGQGATVVVVGGPGETALAERVVQASRSGVVAVLTPSVPALVGLLDHADLMVGNDSGPRHIAAALGTATVSVSTAANLADVAPLFRSRHRVVVDWHAVCGECGRRAEDGDCGHEASGVGGVGVEEVAETALQLWRELAVLPAAPAGVGG